MTNDDILEIKVAALYAVRNGTYQQNLLYDEIEQDLTFYILHLTRNQLSIDNVTRIDLEHYILIIEIKDLESIEPGFIEWETVNANTGIPYCVKVKLTIDEKI